MYKLRYYDTEMKRYGVIYLNSYYKRKTVKELVSDNIPQRFGILSLRKMTVREASGVLLI